MSIGFVGYGVNCKGSCMVSASVLVVGSVGAVPGPRGLTPTPVKVARHSLGKGAAGAVPGPWGLTPTPMNLVAISTWSLCKWCSKSNLPSLLGVFCDPSLLLVPVTFCGVSIEGAELVLVVSEESEVVLTLL